jgi:hypothetical protein
MTAGIGKQAIEAIVGADPHTAALQTLELVRKHVVATAVGLFSVRPELRLYTATVMNQDGLDRVARAWDEHSAGLLAGELVLEPAHAVVPIGRPAVALLYAACAGPRREHILDLCAAVSPLLELAISSRHDGGTYIERTPIAQIEKHQLLLLLDRLRGNVSEVARRLGVTRVTVYQRMKRFGIERYRPTRRT